MAKEKKSREELSLVGKLKQALVPADKQSYEIPENWCWTYLTAGFCECKDSFRKPINASGRAEREGDVPYYGATGQVGWIDDYLTDEQLVLVGEDGAPFMDVMKNKAYIIEGKAWVNNHAHILKSYYGEVGNKFIMHYLNFFNYKGYVNGSTRLKLTQASMNTIPVPLPPLQEQQRIVEQVEKLFGQLDEAKEKIESALEGFEERRDSIMNDAFTGRLTQKWRELHDLSKEDWAESTIKNVCIDIKVGIVIKPTQYYTDQSSGVPAFRSANVRNCFIEDSDWVYINEQGQQENRRSEVHEGDVLIVRSGNPGTACVVTEQYDGYNAIDIIIAVPNGEVINSDYLCYYTNSPFIKGLIKQNKRGMALQHFNVGGYSKLPILLPSLKEQKEIVRLLQEMLNKEVGAQNSLQSVLRQIDLMKKNVLARAFRGKLGTNNPDEDSSIELLKRILEEME